MNNDKTVPARFIRNKSDEVAIEEGCYWDWREGLQVRYFFETYLKHTVGDLSGQPFKLLKWQLEDVVYPLFCWRKSNGFRRFNTVYIEIPRKNGKSTIAAGLALYMLCMSKEQHPEIITAAFTEEQAKIIFNQAKSYVTNSNKLKSILSVKINRILSSTNDGVLRSITSTPGGAHGLNPTAVFFDELHVQTKPDLYDALSSGQAARTEPLFFMITTAGTNKDTICYEMHKRAKKIINSEIINTSFYGCIYSCEEDEDWELESNWIKANPSIGAACKLDAIKAKYEFAKLSPVEENIFRSRYLNQWLDGANNWINSTLWAENNKVYDYDKLPKDLDWYGGIDMGNVDDLTSLVLVSKYEDNYILKPFFWMPEGSVELLTKRSGMQYKHFIEKGLIYTTRGNATDHDEIIKSILEIAKEHKIVGINMDPYLGVDILQKLNDNNVQTTKFIQSFNNYAMSTSKFYSFLLNKQVVHNDNPLLKWMAGNAIAERNAQDQVKLSKVKSNRNGKIDGIVATLMAVDKLIRYEETKNKQQGYWKKFAQQQIAMKNNQDI